MAGDKEATGMQQFLGTVIEKQGLTAGAVLIAFFLFSDAQTKSIESLNDSIDELQDDLQELREETTERSAGKWTLDEQSDIERRLQALELSVGQSSAGVRENDSRR